MGEKTRLLKRKAGGLIVHRCESGVQIDWRELESSPAQPENREPREQQTRKRKGGGEGSHAGKLLTAAIHPIKLGVVASCAISCRVQLHGLIPFFAFRGLSDKSLSHRWTSSSGLDDPRSQCPVVDSQWRGLPKHDRQHIRLDIRTQSRWQGGNEKRVSLTLQPTRSLTAPKWDVAWLTAIIWPVCLILADICVTWEELGDTSALVSQVYRIFHTSVSFMKEPRGRNICQTEKEEQSSPVQWREWGGARLGRREYAGIWAAHCNSWNSWWCLWRGSWSTTLLYKSLKAVTWKVTAERG